MYFLLAMYFLLVMYFFLVTFVMFFSKAERARPYLQTMESHVREQGTDFINAVFVDVSMLCVRKKISIENMALVHA